MRGLQAGEWLGLHGVVGNQAVGRLLESRRLEHEADAAAGRDAPASAAPGHTDDMPGVTPELESGIAAARGGGAALAPPLRRQMERQLGADLGAVRLHTGARADSLSRALHARAFTTGHDVFLRSTEAGAADPAGREVLAHELAHVVQQQGGRAASAGRTALSAVPAGTVQRLVSEADFRKLAGDPSGKSKLDKGKYPRILNQLKEYETSGSATAKVAILRVLKTLCEKWIGKHKQKGAQDLEAKVHKDERKMTYLPALLEEVKHELGELHDMTVETPTETTDTEQRKLAAADKNVSSDLKSEPAAKYQLALYASVQNPYLIPFSKVRLDMTIKNKLGIGPKLAGADIKIAAATQVLETELARKQETMAEADKRKEAQKIADASNAVGHTWVRLRKYDARNQVIDAHSFGFYPLDGYGHPKYAVPGEVVYNDNVHDLDTDQNAQYFDLSQQQYGAALKHAIDTMRKRPDYKLIDYNCTLFAKHVVEAAGQSFPDKSTMRVPANAISAATGIGWRETHNPNQLHDRMQRRQTLLMPSSFNAFDLDEESESENEYVDRLMALKGKDATFKKPFSSFKVGAFNRVAIKADTAVRMGKVEDDDDKEALVAYFEVGDRIGSCYTADLEGLCVALGV